MKATASHFASTNKRVSVVLKRQMRCRPANDLNFIFSHAQIDCWLRSGCCHWIRRRRMNVIERHSHSLNHFLINSPLLFDFYLNCLITSFFTRKLSRFLHQSESRRRQKPPTCCNLLTSQRSFLKAETIFGIFNFTQFEFLSFGVAFSSGDESGDFRPSATTTRTSPKGITGLLE